jgi:hypothetical protein
MRELPARLTTWWREAEILDRVHGRLRPWQAVPALLSAGLLIIGGFWLGGFVGGHASAASLTKTVHLTGKVVTVNGVRYLKTPASTVRIKGKTVHIPARTVKLPAKVSTVDQLVNRTVDVPVTVHTTVPTTVSKTSVTTVVDTVQITGPTTTVINTVTGPTTTVTGPTTTVTEPAVTVTVTVP